MSASQKQSVTYNTKTHLTIRRVSSSAYLSNAPVCQKRKRKLQLSRQVTWF